MYVKYAKHYLMKRMRTSKSGLDVTVTVAIGTIIGLLASRGCPVNGPDLSV